MKSCPKTLCHNTQVLFRVWAKMMVNLSSLEEWHHAANPLLLKGPLKEVCLLIDSFDLALGVSVIGDQLFEIGKSFNNVKFITPIKHATGKRKSGQGMVILTKAEDQLNHAIHSTCAQVEVGFGREEAPFKHCKAFGRRMMSS